jgi:hypothetical protein
MKRYQSRLLNKEEARNTRKLFVSGALILAIILALVFGGIPLLVKIAVTFSDINNINSPIEQIDKTPPAPPQISTPPEAIKINPLTLSGFAEPGSKVQIFLNGSQLKDVLAAEDGTFMADNINLTEGLNVLYATAVDDALNQSQPSTKVNVVLDTKAPLLEISQPQNNAHFLGEKQRKMQIIGKTEVEASLTINNSSEILDKDGNFSSTLTLNEGDNTITITALDLAGNKTEKQIKVTYSP